MYVNQNMNASAHFDNCSRSGKRQRVEFYATNAVCTRVILIKRLLTLQMHTRITNIVTQ